MNAMTVDTSFTDDHLRIDVTEDERAITLDFHGKSMQPDPGSFMMPILLKTLEDAIAHGKRIVMDFRAHALRDSGRPNCHRKCSRMT